MANKKTRKRMRGIFAIEGEWFTDLRGGVSFKPLLDIIKVLHNSPYVHRDAATRQELFYYLQKWTQKRYSSYPILYLGFHGKAEKIQVGDGRGKDCHVTLDDLMEHLQGLCSGRIIYIGSCNTMQIDERRLQRFLLQTGALAICGYKFQIDMLRSAAFELLLFNAMLDQALNLNGVKAMKNRILREERALARELGFRMVVRKKPK
jgi:hypothetical protein